MKKKGLFLLLGLLLTTSLAFSQSYDFKNEFVGSDSDAGNLRNYVGKGNSQTDSIAKAKTVKKNKFFNPSLNMGAGFQLITALSQAPKTDAPGSTNMNFTPAGLEVGYIHADMSVNDKLSAGFSWNVHAGTVCDVFLKYTPFKEFGIQIGRFKGVGNRGADETAIYDADLADFAYVSETQSVDEGSPDTRFYGINLFGQYKWVKYAFFWHKNSKDRTRYWAQVNNDPVPGNGGINLKSWDLALSFTPFKHIEFGGHAASVSRPGMGGRTLPSYSGFLYYDQPKRFHVKFDYVFYYRPIFTNEKDGGPKQDDYTDHDWFSEKKQGFSLLVGGFVNKHIEPVARFEHFYEGSGSVMGYKALNLYTIGFNYYPFPNSPRVGKITAFYQKKDEIGGPEIRNDWFGIQYELVLFGKIFGS